MTLRKREKKFQHPQIWGVAAERPGRLRRGASAAPAHCCRGPAGSRRAARRRAAPGAPGRLRSRCGARRSRGAAGGGRSRSGAASLVHFGPWRRISLEAPFPAGPVAVPLGHPAQPTGHRTAALAPSGAAAVAAALTHFIWLLTIT